MTVVIAVTGPGEALGFRQALMLLSIERFVPLAGALGVPAPMIVDPQPLVDGAKRFWQMDRELERRLAEEGAAMGRDEYRLGTEMLLNSVLLSLGTAYPDEAIRALLAWTARHFVDDAQRANLFIWSQLLYALTAQPSWDGLDDAGRAVFQRAAGERIGPSRSAEVDALIARAEAIQLAGLEKELAGRHPDLHRLVVQSVPETVRNQRTWEALVDLTASLADPGRFLTWARARGTSLGMPSELIRFPRHA